MAWPSLSSSLSTLNSGTGTPPPPVFACAPVFPPKVEKFHFPCWFRTRLSSGFSIVRPVTLSVFEVIRGNISTPTLKLFAVRKGEVLKAGSSAIDRSEAVSEPEKIDKLRSPTCTLRPSAVDSLSSIVGRKEFALMNRGSANRRTINTPTAIST